MSQVLYIVFYCIWYPLYDGISVYLSGACQILQLHQKHLPQCIPDGYPSSSVYSPDGSHHCCYLQAMFFIPKSFRIQSMAMHASVHLFGFALEAFINGHFLVKIFDNYIPADADTQDTDLQNGNSAETSSAENDHLQYDQMGRKTIPLSGLYAERAVWRKGL